LKERDIEHFSTDSDKKASIVERFNRTLKTRMYKYFTAHEARKWVDAYDKLVENYNKNKKILQLSGVTFTDHI